MRDIEYFKKERQVVRGLINDVEAYVRFTSPEPNSIIDVEITDFITYLRGQIRWLNEKIGEKIQ
jgi:hypothetical protein